MSGVSNSGPGMSRLARPTLTSFTILYHQNQQTLFFGHPESAVTHSGLACINYTYIWAHLGSFKTLNLHSLEQSGFVECKPPVWEDEPWSSDVFRVFGGMPST